MTTHFHHLNSQQSYSYNIYISTPSSSSSSGKATYSQLSFSRGKMKIAVTMLAILFVLAASSAEHSRMMLLEEGLVGGFKEGIEGGVRMKTRKVLMVQLQDYDETGANSKHDPNPKKKPSGNDKA